jgi:hypothetical protein
MMLFAAVHESVYGTSRHFAATHSAVAFGAKRTLATAFDRGPYVSRICPTVSENEKGTATRGPLLCCLRLDTYSTASRSPG